MNVNNAFPSKYLKAADFDHDTNVTIRSVEMEQIGQGMEAGDKIVVYFNEFEKGLVCNKTNANTISNLYGPETDGWIGKSITLYATEVQFKDEMVMSIRVRLRAPASAQKANGNGEAKRLTWDAFKAKHPGVDTAQLQADFKAKFTAYFGSRNPDLISVGDWRQFAADGFVKPAVASPFQEPDPTAHPVALDEVPF